MFRCTPVWRKQYIDVLQSEQRDQFLAALAGINKPSHSAVAANRECVELINRASAAILAPAADTNGRRV